MKKFGKMENFGLDDQSEKYRKELERKMEELESLMNHETNPAKYKAISEELEETRLALEAFKRSMPELDEDKK